MATETHLGWRRLGAEVEENLGIPPGPFNHPTQGIRLVKQLFAIIARELAAGRPVYLKGLGYLEPNTKRRHTRLVVSHADRDPVTGKLLQVHHAQQDIPARTTVRLRPSTWLMAVMNPDADPATMGYDVRKVLNRLPPQEPHGNH
jgi:nucleoid DNA-binding protein